VVSSKQGRYNEALSSLLTASECDRASVHPHSSLAAIYDALGDHDSAARHHLVACRLAPLRPNVLLNYAMFLHRHGPSARFRVFCIYVTVVEVLVCMSGQILMRNAMQGAIFFVKIHGKCVASCYFL